MPEPLVFTLRYEAMKAFFGDKITPELWEQLRKDKSALYDIIVDLQESVIQNLDR